MTVTNPIAGRYYSLSVHGEPPEGVEVLWLAYSGDWSENRYNGRETHWMLAPVPAEEPAEVEEPPFPLSREEWEELCAKRREGGPMVGRAFKGAAKRWWKEEWVPSCPILEMHDYDTVVSAWRAAGYPGAVKPEAPEGEAEEGPWSQYELDTLTARVEAQAARIEELEGAERKVCMYLGSALDKDSLDEARKVGAVTLAREVANCRPPAPSKLEEKTMEADLPDVYEDTPDTAKLPDDPERTPAPERAELFNGVEYVRADIAAAELAQVQGELEEEVMGDACQFARESGEQIGELEARIASLERELAEARERGDRWKLNSGQQGAKVARFLMEMAWLARNGHAERAQRAVKSADEAAMRVRLEDFVVAQPCSLASHSVEEDPDG